eukprot:2051649-Amphidinium_carterae.1
MKSSRHVGNHSIKNHRVTLKVRIRTPYARSLGEKKFQSQCNLGLEAASCFASQHELVNRTKNATCGSIGIGADYKHCVVHLEDLQHMSRTHIHICKNELNDARQIDNELHESTVRPRRA